MKIYTCKTLGSILLVAGTSIGAGMLALPIATGVSGFLYSAGLLIVCFLFMLTSLFLLLESNLYSKKVTSNMISMVKERLGPIGGIVAWISFLFLLYAVAAAYLSGGGALLAKVINTGSYSPISAKTGVFVFMVVFGLFVVFGTRAVDAVNRVCMFGLMVSFVALVFITVPVVEWRHFDIGDGSYLWAAIPVVILSFTSHIILPSLRTYLVGDINKLKRSLLYGSLIPLVFYLVWEFLILGVLPIKGEFSIATIAKNPHPISGLTHALNALLHYPLLAFIVGLFAFLALVTSFFGVALALYDFLADGLHIHKSFLGKMILLVLMFVPPLIFALFYPQGFIQAIGYAGVFVAILYGILPVLMVYHARYIEKAEAKYKVKGGKFTLLVIFLGACFIIFLQIAATNHYLPSI